MTTVSNFFLIVLFALALAGIFAFEALIAAFIAVKSGATLTFKYEKDKDE